MDAYERQVEREVSAVREGITRYRRSMQRLTRDLRVDEPLGDGFGLLVDAIDREQRAVLDPDLWPKPPRYALPLIALDCETLAFITLQCIFFHCARAEEPARAAAIARNIGTRCRRQREFDRRLSSLQDVYLLLLARNRSHNAAQRARRQAQLVDADDWSSKEQDLHLGAKLIQLACDDTDVAEVVELRERAKTALVVRINEETQQWLRLGSQRRLLYEMLALPPCLPMIVPPESWQGWRGGGYLTNRDTVLRDQDLVKHRKQPRIVQALATGDLTTSLDAVNALQETPWRINPAIYRVLRRLWRRGSTCGDLPERNRLPLPPSVEAGVDDPELRRERARLYRENSRRAGRLSRMRSRLRAARTLAREERFYYPYQLDYRGRAYPIPPILHPQSDDLDRALLEFADGKPLGEEGAFWLAIHIANCFGNDKVSFAERAAWVEANEAQILAFAADPEDESHPFWQADKPWCLLAACLEWAGYRAAGTAFVSHLPVALDGTCNGLQHLSAMGRDPVGGRYTNLLPGDAPQDLYRQVALRAGERIESDAGQGRREAQPLRGRVTRSIAKKPTMASVYGITNFGVMDFLRQDESLQPVWRRGGDPAYLTRVLMESVKDVVIEGSKIMSWLKQVARALGEAGSGISWTAPTGFPVVLEHHKRREQRVDTALGRLTVYVNEPSAPINVRKQENSIVPNFVHSMDAAHMMLTVTRLHAEGLRHFAAVHDSYAVHACDVQLLRRALREEFVRLHRRPILAAFLEEQRCAHPGVPLPEPPALGRLNIEDVARAEYFFA